LTAGVRTTATGALLAVLAGAFAGGLAIAGNEVSPLVPAVALGAIAIGALALLRPIAAIYLAVLLIPFEAAATTGYANFGVTPTEFIIVATAAGWLIRTLAEGGKFPRSVLVPPLLAALAIHIPGLFLAVDKFVVFKELFMWSAMFVLFLAVLSDERRETTEKLAGAIAAAGAMVAAVAIVKSFGSAQLASDAGGIVTNRAVGPFASPVLLGTFVMITVPMQLVFMLRGRTGLVRLGGLAATALSLTALALSLSRSAFVALTAAVIWIVIWWRPARKPALITAAVLAALLLTRFNPAPSVFNPDVIGERISSIASPDTHTAQARFRMWRKAPEIFEDNFPFGIGPKNLPVRAAEYDLLFPGGGPSNVHNTFLIVATELGVPGIIVLIWLTIALGRILARAIRYRSEPEHSFAIALAATFVALVVDGFTGYSYTANAFAAVVFLLAALAARIERMYSAVPSAAHPPAQRQPEPKAEPALA
jgi:hypothetical protein